MCDKFHIQWCLYTMMDLWNIINDDDDDDESCLLWELHHINIFYGKKAYKKLQNTPISLLMSLCPHVVTWDPMNSDL
jgi:hypothetical protein